MQESNRNETPYNGHLLANVIVLYREMSHVRCMEVCVRGTLSCFGRGVRTVEFFVDTSSSHFILFELFGLILELQQKPPKIAIKSALLFRSVKGGSTLH